MHHEFAMIGTAALLEQLSPFVPDDLVNELVPPHKGRGRPSHWRPFQLYRLLLLTLLTPAHSANLMLKLLGEHRPWRKFAHLPNRVRLPTASQLHDFRDAIGVIGLRRINNHLLAPLLESFPSQRMSVAMIDATDLPSANSVFKKRALENIRPVVRLRAVVA